MSESIDLNKLALAGRINTFTHSIRRMTEFDLVKAVIAVDENKHTKQELLLMPSLELIAILCSVMFPELHT